MMRIEHPFIVNMIGCFQDSATLYLALEFVPGGEVFTILREEGRFSMETSRFYAAEIALAFDYLHQYNIVYRDLKPENLLVSKLGHIKITDFGFAKVFTVLGFDLSDLCDLLQSLVDFQLSFCWHGAPFQLGQVLVLGWVSFLCGLLGLQWWESPMKEVEILTLQDSL